MASTAAPEEGLYSSEEEGLDSEQRELYYNMASESEGFDVPVVPGLWGGKIVPIQLRFYGGQLRFCCKMAMKDYRKKEGKRLKLVKILKANGQVCSPANYYITFEAKDSDGNVEVYQSMVHYRCPRERSEVVVMRLKPSTGSSSTTPDTDPKAESSK